MIFPAIPVEPEKSIRRLPANLTSAPITVVIPEGERLEIADPALDCRVESIIVASMKREWRQLLASFARIRKQKFPAAVLFFDGTNSIYTPFFDILLILSGAKRKIVVRREQTKKVSTIFFFLVTLPFFVFGRVVSIVLLNKLDKLIFHVSHFILEKWYARVSRK